MHPILAGISLLAAAEAGAPGSCALVPRAEIARIQNAPVVSEKESAADSRSVQNLRCYFQTEPFAKSVSLAWTRDREAGGARREWDALFHEKGVEGERGKEEKGEKEERRAAPAPIAGIGDEAFWVPSHASGALYAFGSGSFVRVSVGGEGTDAEKRDRAAALARRALATLEARRAK